MPAESPEVASSTRRSGAPGTVPTTASASSAYPNTSACSRPYSLAVCADAVTLCSHDEQYARDLAMFLSLSCADSSADRSRSHLGQMARPAVTEHDAARIELWPDVQKDKSARYTGQVVIGSCMNDTCLQSCLPLAPAPTHSQPRPHRSSFSQYCFFAFLFVKDVITEQSPLAHQSSSSLLRHPSRSRLRHRLRLSSSEDVGGEQFSAGTDERRFRPDDGCRWRCG